MNDMISRKSLTVRMPLLLTMSILMILLFVLAAVFIRFRGRMIEDYTDMGKGLTNLMAAEIDPDMVDEYIEKNFEMKEYNDVRRRLEMLKTNSPKVLYMYVYKFRRDGAVVIFDMDSENGVADADAPGDIYPLDPELEKNIDDLVAGNETPALIGDTEDGYLLTYCKPLFGSDGKYQCHVCVDFSVEKLHREDMRFVLGTMILSLVAVMVILIADIYIVHRRIAGPLNKMKLATDGFAYESKEDHENNIRLMEALDIRTNDEIEDIYHLFLTFMRNNLLYMNRLEKANDTIIEKDTRLGQVSMRAYFDPLTGAASKAAYDEMSAGTEWSGKRFAVLVYDINDLKYINDNYGHNSGDLYIKGCYGILSEVYESCVVYRIGGDEFAVVLMDEYYDRRKELFAEAAERFEYARAQTDREPWERYSMAGGISEYTGSDKSYEDVFERADRDMYENKDRLKKKYGVKPR